jgi:hypothetical protein
MDAAEAQGAGNGRGGARRPAVGTVTAQFAVCCKCCGAGAGAERCCRLKDALPV